MSALKRAHVILERILEFWLVGLIVGLTTVVVAAAIWRKAGASFVWYDEIGSILLAWITYYGAALAALKRGHIGFDGILLAMPYKMRITAAIIAEIVVITFFIVLAATGLQVMSILGGMKLISLPWVPVQITQSVIPIGAILFIICELLSLPEYWHRLREKISADEAEVAQHLEAHEATKP